MYDVIVWSKVLGTENDIKLPFVIKIFVLSFFEWPLKTGFTVDESLIEQDGVIKVAVQPIQSHYC